MRTQKLSLFLLTILFSLVLSISTVCAEEGSPNADQINDDLSYAAHVSNIGWMPSVKADAVAGTEGQSQNLEAFRIYSNLANLNYAAHIRNVGWQENITNAQTAGTEGQNQPVEAIKISITNVPGVDIYYRAHVANYGWLGWAKNGEVAGTTGCALPVEAFQIIAKPQGAEAPGDTANASIDVGQFSLTVRTHVSNIGWMDPVQNGTAGTIGHNLGIEAVEAKLNDPTGRSGIVGQAFISNSGYQNQGSANDTIGTTGLNRPIEAVRFSIVGPAASIFDVNYRAYSSNLGWLGTTSNNRWAGTKDGALKVEALELSLAKKGTGAGDPGSYKEIDHSLGIIPPGGTSIVINKSTQRMGYYENYNLIVNTNVVTGMSWVDDTLAGDFSVLEKLNYYRTKGPGYDAICRYWLTLYVGRISGFGGEGTITDRVGIHDASWRSDWSSRAYTYNGSHGCVNTPFNAMQTIFTRVPQGAPVRIR